jgi:hypothetical protein
MSVAEATVLTRASREWWRRPDDERYLTLDHLYANTRARADCSEARTVLNTSLVAHGASEAQGELYLEHDDLGVLAPTHWVWGNSRRSPALRPSGYATSLRFPRGRRWLPMPSTSGSGT